MDNIIYTIGRQYGSGGHDVGKALADELGIPFYDRELLDRAAKDSGLCQEIFETNDEKPTSSFLYSLVTDTYSLGGRTSATFSEMPLSHKVFLAQFDTIKNIAAEGPCVIVGRCADYALEDYPNVVSIFLTADLDFRVKRVAKRHDMLNQPSKVKDIINRTDKQRASYYNYYTTKKWGDAASYDLCLNTAVLGIDGTMEIIKEFARRKAENLAENAKES